MSLMKEKLKDVQIRKHQAIFEQPLDHVGFYIIVPDDVVQRSYVYNHQHDNDSTLYFQTKIFE